MPEPDNARALSQRELILLQGRLISKTYVVLIVLGIASLVQMVRYGANAYELGLLTACALSFVALVGYPIQGSDFIVHRLLAFVLTYLGLVPYLLGCSLFFYQGLWRLQLLLDGFSGSVLLVALLYVVGWYAVVSAIYQLTQLRDAIDGGPVVVSAR